jgi:hypothetical protein
MIEMKIGELLAIGIDPTSVGALKSGDGILDVRKHYEKPLVLSLWWVPEKGVGHELAVLEQVIGKNGVTEWRTPCGTGWYSVRATGNDKIPLALWWDKEVPVVDPTINTATAEAPHGLPVAEAKPLDGPDAPEGRALPADGGFPHYRPEEGSI